MAASHNSTGESHTERKVRFLLPKGGGDHRHRHTIIDPTLARAALRKPRIQPEPTVVSDTGVIDNEPNGLYDCIIPSSSVQAGPIDRERKEINGCVKPSSSVQA
eukprot:340999-Amphidinium_carterae.1